ncbi:MAG: TetR family transcriptional regulator [Propionibacteriaceae bacterium]|nr:TetR family transcriptional regulator [Propionibacteriaceae bacterium]
MTQSRSGRDDAPKPRLDETSIVQAAQDIVRESGFDALTLRAVARRLNTGPSSLYSYFPDRLHLVDAVFDAALATVPLPRVELLEPGECQAEFIGLAEATIEVLARYDGIGAEVIRRIPEIPSLMRLSDTYRGLLIVMGVDPDQATVAVDLTNVLVLTLAIQAASSSPPTRTPESSAADQPATATAADLVQNTASEAARARALWSIRTFLDGLLSRVPPHTTTGQLASRRHIVRPLTTGPRSSPIGSGRRLPDRRVAITGLGVVGPGPVGREAFWDAVVRGRHQIRRITRFDPSRYRTQFAGESDFTGLTELLPGVAKAVSSDRGIAMAVTASREALADAWNPTLSGRSYFSRVGVIFASAVAGSQSMVDLLQQSAYPTVPQPVPWPLACEAYTEALRPGSLIESLAPLVQATGPTYIVSSSCTSGLSAIGRGAELIRLGQADAVLVGAAEAPITPPVLSYLDAFRVTSTSDDPGQALRSFNQNRDGFVLGEGAGALILEDWELAVARGARIYAEVSGFGTRTDDFSLVGQPQTDDFSADGQPRTGTQLAQAIQQAIGRAGLLPCDIDYINAHGIGNPASDRHEINAVRQVFGELASYIPISSIKPVIGHTLGASGALDAVACALALTHHRIPPIANLVQPDPGCDLDYVSRDSRRANLRHVLSLGSGFGGFQSAVVFSLPRPGAGDGASLSGPVNPTRLTDSPPEGGALWSRFI